LPIGTRPVDGRAAREQLLHDGQPPFLRCREQRFVGAGAGNGRSRQKNERGRAS
jgi:hypothetical protein